MVYLGFFYVLENVFFLKGIEDKNYFKNLFVNLESGFSLVNQMCLFCSGFLGNQYFCVNIERFGVG